MLGNLYLFATLKYPQTVMAPGRVMAKSSFVTVLPFTSSTRVTVSCNVPLPEVGSGFFAHLAIYVAPSTKAWLLVTGRSLLVELLPAMRHCTNACVELTLHALNCIFICPRPSPKRPICATLRLSAKQLPFCGAWYLNFTAPPNAWLAGTSTVGPLPGFA